VPVGHPLAEGQRPGRGASAVGLHLYERGYTRQRIVPRGEEPDPTAEEPQGQEPPEPEPEYRKGHEEHGVSLLPRTWVTACVVVPAGVCGPLSPMLVVRVGAESRASRTRRH
jgi:hypothetical protein